jgi:hypothetical protein
MSQNASCPYIQSRLSVIKSSGPHDQASNLGASASDSNRDSNTAR